jgi:uncharacterized protein
MRTTSLGKLFAGVLAAGSIFGSLVAEAQDRSSQIRAQLRDRMNANTITIASGNPNGAYLFLGYDMTAVLDKEDGLRVLAYIGKGGQQNVKDALFLRGVDLAITQANVLRYYKRTGELGGDIDRRLVYITRLNLEEMHLVVAENSGINSIQDLAGKTVNFSDAGSGTQLSTQILFQTLKMNVKEVNMGQGDALEKLKSGEIAATFLVAGKPSGAFGKLTPGSGYKILPLAFTPEMEAADFLPTQLTNKDYPLIPVGQTVDTLAVSAVLAAFNWPSDTDRYRRTAAFIEQFFDRIGEFQKPPRHPKWKEVNIAANLPGWTRHPAAQAWIDRHRTSAASTR